jgi:hypothetical protein
MIDNLELRSQSDDPYRPFVIKVVLDCVARTIQGLISGILVQHSLYECDLLGNGAVSERLGSYGSKKLEPSVTIEQLDLTSNCGLVPAKFSDNQLPFSAVLSAAMLSPEWIKSILCGRNPGVWVSNVRFRQKKGLGLISLSSIKGILLIKINSEKTSSKNLAVPTYSSTDEDTLVA